jgi:hypothetical protein
MYRVALEKHGFYRATEEHEKLEDAQEALIKDIETIEGRQLKVKDKLELLDRLENVPFSMDRGDHTFSIRSV